jgi:lysophospholipase L1-like esterase
VGPRFIGRFDMTNPKAPVAEWSGSAISLRFTGTSIGVTLSDGASDVFEVIIDGKQSVVPSLGGTTQYTLGTGLSNGPHDLLIYKRTEAFFGDMGFGGFDIDPSAYLPGDPVPTRRIELIGDSISAGYGDEGTNPCMFMPSTENQYLSYGPLAARAVDAELYTEAWSGIGMVSNSGGDTTNPTMPERYAKTLPVKDTADTWDFSKYVPDAVVINLGTNDFSKADPGMNFQTTYTSFVTMLRGHYPNARIYLAVGPMLGGSQYTQAKTYLNGVISTRAGAGDKNLALLEFGTQDPADGLGCDSHPSLKTHQKMADKLDAALKADLGW